MGRRNRTSTRWAAFAALALGACGPRPPIFEPELLPLPQPLADWGAGPNEPDEEVELQQRLDALQSSPTCARVPSYAVIEEDALRGGTVLGFCDGLIVRRPESGGLIVSGVITRIGPPEGWEARAFALGAIWVRTELPTGVRVRSESDGVRLAGKDFDLRLRAANASELVGALTPPEGCAIVASGARFMICRRGAAHRMIARASLGSQHVLARSDPRMRATREEAEDMVRAVQLMHR